MDEETALKRGRVTPNRFDVMVSYELAPRVRRKSRNPSTHIRYTAEQFDPPAADKIFTRNVQPEFALIGPIMFLMIGNLKSLSRG